MTKVLFVASIASHFQAFHIPYFKWFKERGCLVHAAAKMNIDHPLDFCDAFIDIPFVRSPYSKNNINAYKILKNAIEKGQYDIVHCHTPMAAALTRLAARKLRKNGLKVIYTAHGFHFFKGAPFINWLIYYPVERVCARYTDALITINKEDFDFATKHNFKCRNLFLVPGIGVDPSRVSPTSYQRRIHLRQKYKMNENKFILFYAAELSYRKNQEFILRALPFLKEKIPNILILFAGSGKLKNYLTNLAKKLDVSDNVEFLGYRTDIGDLIALSDVGISSSRQEGLPINIVEDMLTGLPVVGSDCRGNTSLIKENINGFMFKQGCIDDFVEKVTVLYQLPELRNKLGENAKETIKEFSIEKALSAHAEIYKLYL